MAILLNDNLDVAVNKPTDYRYGPYTSTASALQTITSIKRYKGLTVGIISGNSVTDYWFKDDITDASLVEKTTGSSGSGTPGASIVWRGAYNASTDYVALDTVGYNGSAYICIASTVGVAPDSVVTPLKWNLMVAGGTYAAIAGTVSTPFVATEGQTTFFPINGYTSNNADAYTVSIGGVDQVPIQNYTISAGGGGTLTLTAGASAGAIVLVRSMSANVASGAPIVWTGAYSSTTIYSSLDAVSYNGNSYICTSSQNISNITPTADSTKWDVIALKGDTGSTGSQGPVGPAGAAAGVFVGQWTSGGVYSLQDVVRHNLALWCKVAESNPATQEPSSSNSDWSLALKDSVGILRGTWDDSTYYGIGDTVIHNNAVYICQLAINMTSPSAAGGEVYWLKLVEGITGPAGSDGADGAKGDTGTVGVFKGNYVDLGNYSINDVVRYGTALYICMYSGYFSAPPDQNTNVWSLLLSDGAAGSPGTNGSNGSNGAPAGVWKGTWYSGLSYAIGDTVVHNNAVWLCEANASGQEQSPTELNAAYWTKLVSGIAGPAGANGANGINGTNGTNGTNGIDGTDALWNYTGAYSAGVAYAVGDLATYGGSLWYRKNANGGNLGDTPAQNTFWDLIASKGADGSGTGGTGGNTTQIQGFPVSDTQPDDGQVLIWNDTAQQWEPGSILVTGGTITYNTVGVHYFDVPATARWARLQATSASGTDGTNGGNGTDGGTDVSGNPVQGVDGANGSDGEDGKSVKIGVNVIAAGGQKGLKGFGGGGGGGAGDGNNNVSANNGNNGLGPEGGAGGPGGSSGNNGGPSHLGGEGTMFGGNGGEGGFSDAGGFTYWGAGGAGGNNRSGGGGGGGYSAANISRPGKGGFGGTASQGTNGTTIDVPYNLTPYAGGQLAIEITAGAGNASITFTW